MKVVINSAYGGFSLPSDFCASYGYEKYDELDRRDERLIDFIERFGENNRFGDLKIVHVPGEATDWMIMDYDGAESVVYVTNGTMKWAWD